MITLRLVPLFAAICVIPTAKSYQGGAPKSVCDSMLPKHGESEQSEPVPYQLTVASISMKAGETVTLTLNKIDASYPDFKGFLVKAINADDQTTVGSFQESSSSKVIDCNNNTNAVTHKDGSDKVNVTLEWTAPTVSSNLTVKFLFTVVQSKPVFWAKREAKSLLLVQQDANESTEQTVETTTSGAKTTIFQDETTRFEGVTTNLAEVNYSKCGNSHGCFGDKNECIANENCDMMTSYKFLPDTKSFEITLTGNGIKSSSEYLAVGLSEDSSMGDDLVFFCDSGSVQASWNDGHVGNELVSGVKVNTISMESVDGRKTCTFVIEETLSLSMPDEKKIDLANDRFHILLARGQLDGQNLTYHSARVASESPVSFKEFALVGGAAEGWLIQVHGCLMIFAWLASAACGMLMARYYKKTWTSVRPMGKDFWFRFHQFCMTLALVLTLTAFAVILAALKGEPFSPEAVARNPHAVIGIVCIICACFQPVMAYFRPHPGTKFRWLFNWSHWFVGNAAFTFAIAAIFLSVELPGPKLPKTLTHAMIAYVIVHAVIHMVLMLQRLLASRQDGSKSDEHSTGGTIRKGAAFLYFAFVWVFAIAFVIIIILSKQN